MQGGFGITPAYAGKRWPASAAMVTRWNHPRVCGEESLIPALPLHVVGSPPRMRGKDVKQAVKLMMARITPAYAGKSNCPSHQFGTIQDHPRVFGEKLTTFDAGKLIPGSPPRMRGKGHKKFLRQSFPGITPAYAGKRLKRSHSIGHFSCILCLFHSVLHRASVSGGNRAGPCAPPCLPAQNAVPV